MVIVLMGVSGAGKTTVGRLLSESLGWRFHDADDDHDPANREKMRKGLPLTDADREPWLDRVAERIRQWIARGEDVVLACSALSRAHRERLGVESPPVVLVFLKGGEDVIGARLARRKGHFMPGELLPSQLEVLEEPDPARGLVLSIDEPPGRLVEQIRSRLSI